MKNNTLILDSSVVAKWFFPEENSETALKILHTIATEAVTISIPTLLYYELNSILRTAVMSFRIDESKAMEAYQAFLQLNLIAYSSESLMINTLAIALKHKISSYDASYIALAEYLGIPLVTADKKLLRTVSHEFIVDLDHYIE